MRWIKGIDRQPKKEVFIRIEGTKAIGHWSTHHKMFINESGDFFPEDQIEWLDESLPADDMTTAFQNEPVNFLLSNALRHLTQEQQRQLCNALQERLPVPASIEDEAERLYQYHPQNDEMYTDSMVTNIQRSAHITCARQYMDTIEKLSAENSKMRKALEGLTEENNKLAAENHTQSEELGELKNITDGLDGRIINQQRDLLVAYRNKIALMPGITIETILAMLEDDIKTLRTMDGAEIVKNIIDPSNNKS